jgi:hypothetical protein
VTGAGVAYAATPEADAVERFAIRTVLNKLVRIARQTVPEFGTRTLTAAEVRDLAQAHGLAIVVDPTQPEFQGDVQGTAPNPKVMLIASLEESDISRYVVVYAVGCTIPYDVGDLGIDGTVASALALLGGENSPAVLKWAAHNGRTGGEAQFRRASEAAAGVRARLLHDSVAEDAEAVQVPALDSLEAEQEAAAAVVMRYGLPSTPPAYNAWNAGFAFPENDEDAAHAFEPTTAALSIASRAMLLAYEEHGIGWADHGGHWCEVMTGDRLGFGILFSMLSQWQQAAERMHAAAERLAARSKT